MLHAQYKNNMSYINYMQMISIAISWYLPTYTGVNLIELL